MCGGGGLVQREGKICRVAPIRVHDVNVRPVITEKGEDLCRGVGRGGSNQKREGCGIR